MNTNLIHNILNIAIALTASALAFDWSVFLTPTRAAAVIGALSVLKLVINAIRDGFSGLIKEQPPVQ